MKLIIYKVLAIAALAYAGVCIAMFIFQRSLIYYPQPRGVDTPDSKMTLKVDGAELVVSVRPLAGGKAIVYFGGNAEDVSQNLHSFSRNFPDHALYLLHYRGYGGSTGTPTEQANHADAASLFEIVRAQHTDITVIGRSLGSGVAVRLASERPVSRLILITPYDSIEEIAASHYPYLPVRFLLRDRYESGKYAPNIKVPTILLAAENDEVIPRTSTEKLFGRFGKGVASLKTIAGAGHNDLETKSEYFEILGAALW